MFDISIANTLAYNREKCIGCKLCTIVCPHGVFRMDGGKAEMIGADRCMECGACQLNCPSGAIEVESGVGCASAMIIAALTGRKESECCGPSVPCECETGCDGKNGRS